MTPTAPYLSFWSPRSALLPLDAGAGATGLLFPGRPLDGAQRKLFRRLARWEAPASANADWVLGRELPVSFRWALGAAPALPPRSEMHTLGVMANLVPIVFYCCFEDPLWARPPGGLAEESGGLVQLSLSPHSPAAQS